MTRTLLQQALDALENVTQFAEAQICMHEETYRGGVLWEICSQCGAKWADDEGGKPKFKWPKETNAARKTITAIRSALAAPQPEPVAYVPRCHTDGNYCIVGEYKWDEIEEKPFGLADPAHWECAALYAAPPAAPAPVVPVAWEYQNQHGDRFLTHRDPAKWHENDRAGFNNFRALGYAAPAMPLTDEQIDMLWDRFNEAPTIGYRYFVTKAIEQAHGIGGGGNG